MNIVCKTRKEKKKEKGFYISLIVIHLASTCTCLVMTLILKKDSLINLEVRDC